MSSYEYVKDKANLCKKASRSLGLLDTKVKNKALLSMGEAILKNKDKILEANKVDLKFAREKNMSKAMVDRLLLNENRIYGMAEGLKNVAALEDPIGEVIKMWKRPNGIEIGQITVPIGVIGFIYEARPNVTPDAAGLCIKSGNAVLLKGGSEAINSNKVISKILYDAGIEAGLPEGFIQFIDTNEREVVSSMIKLNEYIDVVIPRGGRSLIDFVVKNSTVPVIQTGAGNCHIFVDESADINMALDIIVNAKTQRPAVCNAMETLLVHKNIAKKFLPVLKERLEKLKVEIRGCSVTKSIINCKEAEEKDFDTEYLDLILAVKVVNSIDEAIDHIYKYSTKHSEAIITNDYKNSQRFLKEIDSSAVYVNASTRFTDGSEFGFGAEIGISTQKLHARGPMGIKQITTTKYIIYGNGQIRD
ncbi:glutamate-5-semialdehyde dehydrogenase [Haloimpatiens sp. FM7315]|uniref:glutamate-5-semialdehyde dehydrogenase n=1 Tax=Haloimpatiens sp. FM7315 TaxID=3298609 RepID=UPI0035A2C983